MKNKDRWIDILIFNFYIVALLGVTLRSKILFSIPFLDYNRLLDAHFHFAFTGWVTLALVVLMVSEILPVELNSKRIYKWLPGGILAAAWLLLLFSPLPANSPGASLCSTIFILVTYVFAWAFIRDMRHAVISKAAKLLSVSAVIFLVASSTGVFALAYLFATKSLNSFAYRDALYTYLHFQYNGFFTLGVFAILVNKLETKMSEASKRGAYQFSVLLCISTFLSLFLTYLWRDPNIVYRILAICGSITLLLTFAFFIRLAISMKGISDYFKPQIRPMVFLFLGAFLLKIFLQSFTLFPVVGNAVFGDRPVIIGFLHLVFLGFVTLFLFTWFANAGYLNVGSGFTKFALGTFTVVVFLNEAVLMTQGLGAMFIKSSYIFTWLLWALSILLFISALLIGVARIKTKAESGVIN